MLLNLDSTSGFLNIPLHLNLFCNLGLISQGTKNHLKDKVSVLSYSGLFYDITLCLAISPS